VTGVLIWRPMLPHPKSDVLAYAHRYGVPYFKDSTPAWSTRGRLRNELLPLIAQVGTRRGAHHLGLQSLIASERGKPIHAALATGMLGSSTHPHAASTSLTPHPRGALPAPAPGQIYGEGYGTHLNALARDSALVAQLMDSQLLEPFRRSLHKSPMGVWFDAAERASLPLFFWREARRTPAPRPDPLAARSARPASPQPPHRAH
jgi:hypothetical protein